MYFAKKNVVCILCALVTTFLVSECFSQETVESLMVKEAQVARESAEKRSLELELELRKLRNEHDALRSRYAALYVESHEALRNLREMEVQAARLIQKKSSDGEGQADVLETLELMVTRQLEVKQTLAEFEKELSSLIELLQPSEAVKSELNARLEKLKKAVEYSLQPVPELSRQQTEQTQGITALILAVNRKDETVTLDKGSLHGVQPGKIWTLLDKNGVILAKLQTVACRSDFCAAVLLQGKMSSLNEGTLLNLATTAN